MDFLILGPLEVRDGNREVRLRGGKQRALLALLLVNANRTLAIDRIVDDLWGDDVPESAHKMVQINVSKLRKLLPPETLHTRPPGYALALDEQQLDLHRFEGLVAEARRALDTEHVEDAAKGFREALSLWRGPALAEFASEPFALVEAARLEDLRLAALEGRLEADLQLGRHNEVAGELEALIARTPLREGLRRQHMLALYRSGRQAEALAAYQDLRRALADELGLEPSPALRDLERRILQQDTGLDLPAPGLPPAVRLPAGHGGSPQGQPPVRYARSDDLSIAYQVTGDGPIDIILVPGWVSHLEKDWEEPRHAHFLDRLGSVARLIRFDKRGTGLSDRPPRPSDLESRMDDVRAVMDATGSRRAVLFGYSEGAPMAILFAVTYPERVRALVLYGAYAKRLDPDDDYPWAPTRESRAAYAEHVESDWGFENDMKIMCPSADDAMARWWGERSRAAASPGAIKALIEMNSLVDVRPLLGAVRVPTLVVHRGTDYDVKVDEGRYVAERIPGARFVELPGADHFVAVDSDQILDVVEPFLVECGAAHLSVHEESRSVTTLLSLAVARNHATVGRELLPQHVEAVRVELARFRGRAVRGPGDDLLATFDGPARAVRCAAASVRALQLLGVTVRAGVHTGEVEVLGDRVRGVAVQIAAHIAQEAAPGEVLVSRTVKDLVAGAGLEFTDRGSRAFAGAPGEWQVLAVAGTDAEADDVPVAATAATVPFERAVVDRADREDEMLKLVTVLFADIVDSTALAETRHPEDVRDLMADYFAAMTAEIEAEGGTIEKFIGDAIMAVFGVPSVREDDAVRAVRAAWRMRERLRSWSEARGSDQPLEIRIGLSTGEVLAAGAAGGNLHVTGDSVNVAARLQQAAEPGTIVLADRTARAVRSRFALRAIEPVALKGRSEALAAWLVERGEGLGQPAEGPGIATPIVGRDNELALLRTSFDHVGLERRPALVTVVGDAGVGKSRLVREFLSSLEAEAKVLIGRCLSYGRGVTLWPLAEMLKAEAGVHETDRSDDAFRKIVRFVGERVEADDAGDPARVAAALASTLGLRPPGDPLGSLDPRELYRELVGAWLVLLAAMGSRGPVVAVVEDLHWADSTLLDVLDELAERVAGPIFFLCTARPDLLRARPDWGGGRRTFSSLPLDPLSGEESARLVSFLPGVDEWPDAVRHLILERAGGNPFFLEEIVRHLVDEGLLVWEDERWRARSGIERAKIPDNIHAVILARLDLLSPDERRVAQRAAVVGRVFWDGALARLSPAEDLDAALRTLRRREFVVERLSSTIPGQTEYVFKHVLLRDVAYASLPRAERGRAHAETAAWIEETSGERTGELAELLAHHYDAAFSFLGDDRFRRSARAYLLTGAANAHRRFAIQQGDRLARRAVELSEGAAERVESLEALGDLQYLAFLGDAAWRTYGEALAELSDDDPAFPRLAGKATLFATRFLGTMHELPEVERVRHIVERGLLATPARGPERTLLLVNRGFLVVQREGRHDDGADAAVREAAAAAEELDDADLLSAALDLVATHEENAGRYGDAYRTDLRRNGLVARMADVKEIGDSYAVAARAAHFVGRFHEAESHASAGIERARGIDSGSYLHALTWRVSARFALGEWQSALADQEELERVAPLSPRALPPAYAMGAYTRIALCHELRGEGDEADRYIELALRYFEQVRHARQGGSIHIPPLALTLARRGRFDEALAPIPYMPRSTSASTTLEVLCEIAAMRERWDEAAGLVSAARDEAVVGEQLSLPPFADRLEGRAAHAEGDLAAATELLARSAEGFAAIDARWDEAWSRLLLAEVVAGSDGRRAEQELAVALPVFERLGSVGEIERARALRVEVAASG